MNAQTASDLVAETISLVRASPRPIGAICREAGTTYRWFCMLASGQIRSPQIHRIYRLRAAALAASDSQGAA